jgi:TPR repeat protein
MGKGPVHQWPIATLRRAAEAGNLRARYWLGRRYEKGLFTPENRAEAIRWYVAARRDPEALSALGACFMDASLDERAHRRAIRLLTRAARRRQPKALWNLAMMALRGIGCRKDECQARALLREGAALGDAHAMVFLARLGLWNRNPEASSDDIDAWFAKAAALGHPEACMYHGRNLRNADPRAAMAWLAKGARQGHAESMYELSVLRFRPDCRPDDLPRIIALCRRSAEMGYRDAIGTMALACLRGLGDAPPSFDAAMAWARLAMAKHHPKPLLDIATSTYAGQSVPRNLDQCLQAFSAFPANLAICGPIYVNIRSLCLSDLGIEPDEAVRLAESLVEQSPLEPDYLDTLGWALFQQGRTDEAEPLIQRALAIGIKESRADVLFHLSLVHWRRRQWRESRRLLREAMRSPKLIYRRDEIRLLLRRAALPQSPTAPTSNVLVQRRRGAENKIE